MRNKSSKAIVYVCRSQCAISMTSALSKVLFRKRLKNLDLLALLFQFCSGTRSSVVEFRASGSGYVTFGFALWNFSRRVGEATNERGGLESHRDLQERGLVG